MSERRRRRLIIVSNRGPVTYGRDASGTRTERRGAGGLVTALRGLLEHHDVTWIASATTDEDRVVAMERSGDVVMVAHEPRAYDLYYNVVANPMLWFIQHSLWGPATSPVVSKELHDAWRDGYEVVNATFAEAVVAQLDNSPDAAVFFHDYHLYLTPRMVRELRPDAKLAHFVHIPWPVDWTTLPLEMRRAVHEGLLANDVVGFHTERWARNFRRSCTDVLGGVGDTHVAHHPISIDVEEFERLRERDDVLEAEERLDRPEKLVVRVDRTDPSKNIVRGFRAFGILLDEHPEWRGRVKLLARLDPSRETIAEYVAYREAIEHEAQAVSARHPGAVDVQLADAFAQSVAAYKQYDVLFVNAVYDGMNLVAKEGPLVNGRAGVLVLSENAGAHEELGEWAVTINPFDVWGQAEALHEALSMDEGERGRRADAIRAQVRENDVSKWVEGLLSDLDRVSA
jgi:trehalose 6-phosphate synthase